MTRIKTSHARRKTQPGMGSSQLAVSGGMRLDGQPGHGASAIAGMRRRSAASVAWPAIA